MRIKSVKAYLSLQNNRISFSAPVPENVRLFTCKITNHKRQGRVTQGTTTFKKMRLIIKATEKRYGKKRLGAYRTYPMRMRLVSGLIVVEFDLCRNIETNINSMTW